MGSYLNLIWLTTVSILMLGVSGVWFYREFNPEWKQCQRAALREQIAKLEESYTFWSNPEYGEPKEAEKLKTRLDFLRKKRLAIKQILLKGEGLWSNQENGPRVDRCMTCHFDEEKLGKEHPEELPIPFDIYGCTVCHNGNGKALEFEPAHEKMYTDRKSMEAARFESADELIDMWKRISDLNPEKVTKFREESLIGPTGEYQIYVGRRKCIKCHKKTHPEHLKRWAKSKFNSFERISKEPDFQKGDIDYRRKCYKCHTTGYREDKDLYAEQGVGCEACHGPGEVYSELMGGKKTIEEARKLTRISFEFNTCGNCHIPKRHEMRKEHLEEREMDGEE